MKKTLSMILVIMMLALGFSALAENSAPPEMPSGMGTPPEGMGTPPDLPEGGVPGEGGTPSEGGAPGEPPEGMPGGGMPGGMGGSGQPESYDAVNAYDADAEVTGEIASTGADENAVLVTGGTVTVTDATVTRTSSDSTGGDAASFYGVGAALLATGGTLVVDNAEITTDAAGGAGVFAYGDGVVYVSDSTIATEQGTSGGIHVAGGGTLVASNLDVTTQGGSSAAIRSDRGGGTMIVDGGSYTANGSGSPAVYVTADITIRDAALTATGSEALCLEGRNAVRLYNCTLTGDMPDQAQNDNTWTVILYQSMSGDSEVGQGSFEMDGGTLISQNGGLFYTTNTDSVFTLRGVDIVAAEDCEYFLRCTGNANQRGWGATGTNGANCVFTAIRQDMDGDVLWDSISNLDLYLTEGSVLTGAVIDDESCAGEGGDGGCRVVIDETSTWVVTGDSTLTALECAGAIVDAEGGSVTIAGSDGTVYVQGDSGITVTVDSFSTEIDLSGAGSVGTFEAHSAI